MKNFLIAFFLMLASLSAQAQIPETAPLLIKRVGDQYITTDSVGTNLTSFLYEPGYAQAYGLYIKVGTNRPYKFYTPAKFRDGSNNPYGATVSDAVSAFLSSGLPSTGGSGGSATTNAGDLTTGTLNDLRLSGNVTKQGNTFNGASQLVKLDGAGKLPAIDGSQLTGLPTGGSSLSLASQAEAIAGTDNVKYLSSLRLAQVIANFGFLPTSTYSTNRTADQTAAQNPANITTDATHRWITDALLASFGAKQAALVSGTNLKTVNGTSLLGSGDLVISGGNGTVDTTTIATKTYLGPKLAAVYAAIDTTHSHFSETDFFGTGTTGQPIRVNFPSTPNPRGAWAASTLYLINDLVQFGGNTYRANANFTSGATFNASNWDVWAAKGQDGTAGLNGDYNLFPTMLLESESIAIATANVTPVSGSVFLRKVTAPKSGTATQIGFRVSTAGSSLTAGVGNNAIAILDASGTRLGIADCNTAYTTVGDKLITMDVPVVLVAGTAYYIATIATATTLPILTGVGGTNLINYNQTSAPFNHGRQPTGGIGTSVVVTGGTVLDARSAARFSVLIF